MPYINTKTNTVITKEKEIEIKKKLGKAIELIPGKNENWLMVSFEDQCSMYFKGKSEDRMAFVEVKLFGSADSGAYNKLTAAITTILKEELDINPDHIYVKYEEVSSWGWNGSNF
ncbi:phenylpyruvate tautomerase MIF-related protein [Anaerocolumna sp. MB42-C2]|uniref:phenylpyruvate tautomerase MIF-related protein n=1 Tax=Anaerocolumna sp. MB42-C2 TaxID=3070997 RepID=UPI0027E133BD|nr:phenylpyruvate tautomerase MIF-related protein [Anaerocolumna sp. MB42-C2]WMJ90402.1 phenylpyruvate tautomerase MIF-related protein [Anaerocolumna sp. MB42-C2]